MSKTDITNTSTSDFVLPNGLRIPKGATLPVEDWAKIENHSVVKAWVEGQQLVVGDVSSTADTSGDDGKGNEQGAGDAGNDASVTPKTEAELTAMKNDELEAAITAKGGEVKTTWNKVELVKQALALKV